MIDRDHTLSITRQAALQGCIGVLATNAGPNLPPWGGLKKLLA